MSDVSRQSVIDLCEKAVLAAELQIALCPDQSIAMDMVNVVAKTLRHRIQSQWPTLRAEARMVVTGKAAGFVRDILKRVKEKP